MLFATVRGHEVNEGFLVSSMLYALIMPPEMPLWQVALGISFGIVIGKEVFGGTGKNFLNPALTGRAFLYFAYPASMSGDSVWVAVDGYTSGDAIGLWLQTAALMPFMQLITAGCKRFLVLSPVAWVKHQHGHFDWRGFPVVYTGCFVPHYGRACLLGMVATSLMFNIIGSDTNPMFALPWYWHLTMGGFAFGMVYMATDPVSAAMTNTGRWVFGGLVGVMTVLIRVVNPAFPEGIMLAILFSNMFAPTIDYFVIQANIRRRMKRHA